VAQGFEKPDDVLAVDSRAADTVNSDRAVFSLGCFDLFAGFSGLVSASLGCFVSVWEENGV
jgi:hypothetical protein